MKTGLTVVLLALLPALAGPALADPKGLNLPAMAELRAAGVYKYLGEFNPSSSEDVGDGWTRHSFDPLAGNGPICIGGTSYSVFTREGKSKKDLMIFQQGGGACWQDFYQCNVLAEEQFPPFERGGIWDFDTRENPFRNHNIVFMPYCDGSVFSGDNDVLDPAFGEAIGAPEAQVRFHRGLRNQSAGMDVAKAVFPKAKKITLAGSSGGGTGVASQAPFLARMVYGNKVDLRVFNDAGPVTVNPTDVDGMSKRAADWGFGQFYPESCTDCDVFGQNTNLIRWRLDNDSTIQEAYYQTDADLVDRFFLRYLGDQPAFRELIITQHSALNAAHPNRYNYFLVAGDTSHTALQTPLFYTQAANGELLVDWTRSFLKKKPKKKVKKKGWRTIIEDPAPVQ